MVDTRPVGPDTCSNPALSTAMEREAASSGYLAEYTSFVPDEFSPATKSPPWDHPCAFGKSGELVVPTSQT